MTINASTTPPIRDFFVETARGNIFGGVNSAMGGHNHKVEVSIFDDSGKPNNIETVWEQGGRYVYLTTDTQLYASSTDAGDNQILVIIGLDDNYEQVIRFATLNGQNQVALNALIFRIFQVVTISSTNPVGDIYIAESDSLTGGVPDTVSKIKSKMVGGTAQSAQAITTVPAGKTAYIYDLEGSIGKSKDTNIFLGFRPSLGLEISLAPPFEIFQTTFNFLSKGILLVEKTDIEINAATRDIDSPITAGLKFILFDN
jgi:hypothetical protein